MESPSAHCGANIWPANKEADFFGDAVVNVEQPSVTKDVVPVTQKSSFKDLFAFTQRSHISIIICAFVTAALVAAGKTAFAILLGKIFDVVSRFGALLLTSQEFISEISQWALYLTLLGFGVWLSASLDATLWVITGELRARAARNSLFASLLKKTTQWYDSQESGMSSLMVGIQTQIRELQTATSQTLGFLISDIFVFGACIIVAFFYSYKLTLVMLATGIPSALILWSISRFLDPAIEAQKRELAEATKHVTAATTAIDLVKVYNGADHEAFRFTSAIRRSAKYYSRQVLCNCGQMAYIKLWMIMLFVIGFYFAVVLVIWGDLTPGNALTTFYSALIAFQSLERLGPQWLVLAKGMAAGQLLHALVSEIEDGQIDNIAGLGRPLRCCGEIRMGNVSFAYPSNPTQAVLSPSNFQFYASDLTFVVGRSGSGKSTLANLLLRFYEPLTGIITVDGNPIQSMDLEWVRENITLVQQSSILFNDTFFKNVAFGAPNPDLVPVEDVKEACNMALLQSTISGMPDGLETMVGPGGHSLSGGQRQRLALARAKLRDSPVLILDEITSGLDPVSRSMIMEAIRLWRKDKTTIIITHEVGQIEDNDYVYVLEDGDVVQEGFRKNLAETSDGLFATLLASADEAFSPRHSGSIREYEKQEYASEDDHSIVEGRYERFLHALSINNRPHSGVFHHRSWMVEPINPITNDRRRFASKSPNAFRGPSWSRSRSVSRRRSLSRHDTARRTARSREPTNPLGHDSTASMEIITQMGLETQKKRRELPQRRNAAAMDSDASLDSLELFFLERLAKGKDKKKEMDGKSREKRLPSLKSILRTLWPTLDGKGKFQLVLGVFLCLVVSGSTPVFSYIFAQLLASFWVPENQQEVGSRWAKLLAIVAAVDASATFFAYFFMERVGQKWVNTLRAEAIRRILNQPKAWFDKASHSPARITQCLDRNAEEMRKLVGMFVPILLIITCMISASLVWALIIRWDLTLVTLAGLPVTIIAARGNSVVSDKWESICDGAAAKTNAIFTETFSNIKVVRALTLESYFTTKHQHSAATTYCLGLKRAVFVGVFCGLYQAMSFFMTALVFYYGSKLLSEGVTTVTDVLKVINLVLFSLSSSVAMLGNLPQIAAAKTTAIQMLHFANLDHSASHEAQGTTRVTTPLPVRMTNLCFAYPGAPKTLVLRSVNLQIDPGTCTAIVGASGCGKSTIAALLLGLYEPLASSNANPTDEISIAYDPNLSPTAEGPELMIIPPTPVREAASASSPTVRRQGDEIIYPSYPPPDEKTGAAAAPLAFCSLPSSSILTTSLRSFIGYVPQHPFLFPCSVRDNIVYGLPEYATALRAQANIDRAARAAGIHDFIISLPQGYDTLVGEGGMQVSGGQAQRLGIARALVRRPKLLVMDEPTSALDATAAEAVRKVVRGLVDGVMGREEDDMAVVVITHSKEMMRIADRLVMMDQGTVVEVGNRGYDELVAQGGKFAQLVGGGGVLNPTSAAGGIHKYGQSSSPPPRKRGQKMQRVKVSAAGVVERGRKLHHESSVRRLNANREVTLRRLEGMEVSPFVEEDEEGGVGLSSMRVSSPTLSEDGPRF
ncbi:P-loop containing nucleoside triphosphate hydrolase protein [Podospora didyma]|uniref:P-loop containing nucleoside triphosphate hydrolase protein n=1 Tax=Podospora didyma TaxID=330526 RepID=A0AAE0NPN8_9PEZI|nr:P-loop containing nucleoside triphosphate hydrolase protein [Podospora didyma]